jgi:HEAT repeat protein
MPLFGSPDPLKLMRKRDVKGLIKALSFQDSNVSWARMVRFAAAAALGEIGDARAVEPLVAALQDRTLREVAARALGQIGDARAVEPLLAALQDPEEEVRVAAVSALGEIMDARVV